mgnify:CR=1 FL=1
MTIALTETSKTSLALPHRKFGEELIYYPESDGKPIGETDLHIILITELFNILKTHFHHALDVKVIADMMFYYEEGNPQKCISPDVMVVKGVGKHLRRVYKTWEEKIPDVIFEISSRKTWREDIQKKYTLYQGLGVKEYYIFDPEYKYLAEPLLAHHLKDGTFRPIKVKKHQVFSPCLNLEIIDTGETLRLLNPETNEFLLNNEELVQTNEVLAHKLSKADDEIERLKAELAKLKKEK